MDLIRTYKRAWKFISIQCFAAIAAGQGTIGLVAALGIKSDVYEKHGYLIGSATIVLAFLGSFGVLVQQDSLPSWLPWSKLTPKDESKP